MTSEIALQSECFRWAWNNFPETRRCIFHVPNGGLRSKIEAMQLKASGVISGIPDVLFVWKGKLYPFEFKAENGRISPQQSEVHKAWLNQGVEVKVIKTFGEWEYCIKRIINGMSN